ncbi:hypothetical protein AB0F11_10090 [Streptomyces sp. NPDC032472]|uniref:hypothetical protein n=1 Tax=Streptomyces sp. NPDC032472 TaxID=3155018 RepID=UPI003400835C
MRTGLRRRAALLTLPLCTAAACLSLTGCGGPAPGGYAAAGAVAAGPERRAGDNVPPQAPVEFQQLGGPSATGGSPSSAGTTPGTPDAQTSAGSAGSAAMAPPPGGTAAGPATPQDSGPATPPGTPATPGTPTPPGGSGGSGGPGSGTGTGTGTTPPPPSTPAKLTLSTPTRTPAPDRWCERVTVAFTNTGTTAARSGTVTFETHVIGALGIDWATITTAQPLPAPLPGGATRSQTYTVCVESWRVPLGMHVETRKVTAAWS